MCFCCSKEDEDDVIYLQREIITGYKTPKTPPFLWPKSEKLLAYRASPQETYLVWTDSVHGGLTYDFVLEKKEDETWRHHYILHKDYPEYPFLVQYDVRDEMKKLIAYSG